MFEPIFTRLRNTLLFRLEQVLISSGSGLQLILQSKEEFSHYPFAAGISV